MTSRLRSKTGLLPKIKHFDKQTFFMFRRRRELNKNCIICIQNNTHFIRQATKHTLSHMPILEDPLFSPQLDDFVDVDV